MRPFKSLFFFFTSLLACHLYCRFDALVVNSKASFDL